MAEIIRIENLEYDYLVESEETSRKRALDGINLNIEQGSFTAIIGRNGSGKSTLAKNLNGLLIPTGGAVYVKGWDTRVEEYIWDIRQAAGMVFQNPDNQLVSSIVEDDVAFGPENLGMDPEVIRARVDKALEDVRMGEFKRKAPHLLSGGQKQRIAIAGAIAMKPDCIIFDEPTAMLDPAGRRDIMGIIKDLNKDGITTILITHFMEEAVEADRVIIMSSGKVLLDGSPEEVFSETEVLESASLEVPMVVALTFYLRARGISVPEGIVTEKALVDFIAASAGDTNAAGNTFVGGED